jgi:hypothetical protein
VSPESGVKRVEDVAVIGKGRFVPDCLSVFSLSIGVLKKVNGGGSMLGSEHVQRYEK